MSALPPEADINPNGHSRPLVANFRHGRPVDDTNLCENMSGVSGNAGGFLFYAWSKRIGHGHAKGDAVTGVTEPKAHRWFYVKPLGQPRCQPE